MKVKQPIPETLEHAKLRELSKRIKGLSSNDPALTWLGNALYQIGCGADANVVFRVNRGKGQNVEKELQHYKREIALRWIAGRLNPIGDEVPPKKSVAIQEAAELFSLDEDNLKRVCPKLSELSKMVSFGWDDQRPTLHYPRD